MSYLKAKPKKRVFIFNYEFPPLGGGGGRSSFFLAPELVRKGWEVKVITSGFRGLAKKEIVEGVEILRIPVLRSKIHQASVFEMITYIFSSIIFGFWHARRGKPDISLAYFGIPSGPAAFLLKLLYRIPYYVLLLGGDVPGFSPRELTRYHRLTRPIIHLLWREAQGVIANSKGLQELASKSLPQVKIKVLTNGVDKKLFSSTRIHGENPKEINILFAGRFTPQKGADFLLNTLTLINSDIPKTNIWLVGDGPERKNIEQLAAQHNFNEKFSIVFLGWKPIEELYELYRQADIFILPSRDEGMATVLLEAMATALPVVATKVPGSEELVHDGVNGFLVNKDDSEGFAQALEMLISEPALRQKMGMEGRKIAGKFSWEKIADQLVEQFQEISL